MTACQAKLPLSWWTRGKSREPGQRHPPLEHPPFQRQLPGPAVGRTIRARGWAGAAYCIADHRQRPVAVILFCFTPHYGQFVCCSHALPFTCSSAPIVWHSFTPSSWHLRGGLCRQRRRRRAVPWGPCLGGVCAHVCLRECMRECKSGKLQRCTPCLCGGNP